MRILVDLLHPAHVHFFRHAIGSWQARGDEVLVTARDKDVTIDLLEAFGIPHVVLSSQATGPPGLAAEWGSRTARLVAAAHKFAPDVLMGIMGVSIAPAGRVLRRPAFVFYDTEMAEGTNRFVYPLATAVVTPDCYRGKVAGRHVVYPGYHELAYLHPTRFSPSQAVLGEFGLSAEEPFAVVRFVAWEATHDRGEIALTVDQKTTLVDRLQNHGRVVISSEGELPPSLEPLRLVGPVHRVHHVLAHATVYVGESATMAAEAAVLGTPAVYIALSGRGYIDDLQARYGLTEHFSPKRSHAAVDAAERLLAAPDPSRFRRARAEMLSEKVDVTTWVVGFLDSYHAGLERP